VKGKQSQIQTDKAARIGWKNAVKGGDCYASKEGNGQVYSGVSCNQDDAG